MNKYLGGFLMNLKFVTYHHFRMLSTNFNFKHKISDHDMSKKSFMYNRREGEENLGENVNALFNMSII